MEGQRMTQSREVRVGVFLLVAFLIVIVLFELLGRETLFSRSVEYRTSFRSIPTLKLGDPVRLAGVDVGTVQDIRIIGARVEVVMRIKPGTPVKTDSVATIKLTSLLGTYFMDLSFGSPAAQLAPPGSMLVSSEPPDINTLVARLNDAAGDIQTLARQLNEGLGKSLGPIQATFQTFDKIASKIEKGQGTLGKLISDDSLYLEIRGLAGNLNQVSQQLAKGQGTLGKLITDDGLYRDMRSLTADLRGATGSLNRMMRDIDAGKGTLGKLVRDESLYTEARQTLGEARAAMSEGRAALSGVKDAVASFKSVSAGLAEGKGTLGKLMTDDALYNDMRGTVASLHTIMQKVEKGEGTLGKIINDDSLYYTTKDSMKKMGKGMDTLREQGPLSLIGIAIQGFGLF
jgi:phospholipid/cholesterol/gamma-HCH transport system substrate-binding protein